eukprot:COSAG06_NODE_268_length_18811_cov_4.369549_5_plen_102_part_00
MLPPQTSHPRLAAPNSGRPARAGRGAGGGTSTLTVDRSASTCVCAAKESRPRGDPAPGRATGSASQHKANLPHGCGPHGDPAAPNLLVGGTWSLDLSINAS